MKIKPLLLLEIWYNLLNKDERNLLMRFSYCPGTEYMQSKANRLLGLGLIKQYYINDPRRHNGYEYKPTKLGIQVIEYIQVCKERDTDVE